MPHGICPGKGKADPITIGSGAFDDYPEYCQLSGKNRRGAGSRKAYAAHVLIGVNNGYKCHAAEQKGKQKSQIVIVVNGSQKHSQQQEHKNDPITGRANS